MPWEETASEPSLGGWEPAMRQTWKDRRRSEWLSDVRRTEARGSVQMGRGGR